MLLILSFYGSVHYSTLSIQQSVLYSLIITELSSLWSLQYFSRQAITTIDKCCSSQVISHVIGCKIKSLRTQTNTYIRTPVRGQDPMFVVTGRKEDVAKAKQQILSAAEHFSSIRAKRNGSVGPQGNGPISSGTCSPTGVTPGSITISVRVPYKVVGLVVGPKGATIKRIQQTTSTYIVTPGRDKDPVFEVTGNEEQVERAREEIEKHIISRTSTTNNSDLQIDDFQINGIDTNYNDQSTSKGPSNNCLNNYNNISNHHETVNGPSTAHQMYRPHIPSSTSSNGHHHMSNAPQPIGTSAGPNSNQSHLAVCATSTTSSMPISEYSMLPNSSNIQYRNNFESDDGLGSSSRSSARSSSISHSISRSSIYEPSISWTDFAVEIQRSNSVSVQTKPDFLPPGDDGPHPRTRRTNSDPVAQNFHDVDLNTFTNGPMNRGTPNGGSPRLHRLQSMPRDPLDELCEKCDRQTSNTTYAPCARRISRCANCGPELCQMERDTRRQCGHSVLVDTPGNLRRN